MLIIPESSPYTACIQSIDPGTKKLGLATIELDVRDLSIVRTEAVTLRGDLLGKNSWGTEIHGDKLGRIMGLEDELYRRFCQVRPFAVASESPFFSYLHPNAFQPLIETVCAVRNAVTRYDNWTDLYMIDPPSVKNAVGAKGGDKKNPVREGILNFPENLHFTGLSSLEELDEHSYDALAVGICYLKRLRDGSLK